MKAGAGIAVEVAALAGFLALNPVVPPGIPFALYVIVTQLLAAYLVHCPAHYLVATAVGIKFRTIRMGRTTMAKALPASLAGPVRLLPVPTLSTVKESLARVSKRRAASMYASGVAASVSSAILIAAVATWAEPLPYAALAWAMALGYLVSDLTLSPRGGDLMKARAVLGP